MELYVRDDTNLLGYSREYWRGIVICRRRRGESRNYQRIANRNGEKLLRHFMRSQMDEVK